MKNLYLAIAWLCLFFASCKKDDLTQPQTVPAFGNGNGNGTSSFLINNDFDAASWEGDNKSMYDFKNASITCPDLNKFLYMPRAIWNKKIGRRTYDKWTITSVVKTTQDVNSILPGIGFRTFGQGVNAPYELMYVYFRGDDVQFPNTLQLRFVDHTHKITYNQFSKSLGQLAKDDRIEMTMSYDAGKITVTAKVLGKPGQEVSMSYNGNLLSPRLDGGFVIMAGNMHMTTAVESYQVTGNSITPTGVTYINNDFKGTSWEGYDESAWQFTNDGIISPDLRKYLYMERTIWNTEFGRQTLNKWTTKLVFDVTTDSALIFPGIGLRGFGKSENSPYELVYVYLRGKDVQFPNTLQLRFVDYTHQITFNDFSPALGSFGKGDRIEVMLSFTEGKLIATAKVLTKPNMPGVTLTYTGNLLPKWMDGGFCLVAGNHPATIKEYSVTSN